VRVAAEIARWPGRHQHRLIALLNYVAHQDISESSDSRPSLGGANRPGQSTSPKASIVRSGTGFSAHFPDEELRQLALAGIIGRQQTGLAAGPGRDGHPRAVISHAQPGPSCLGGRAVAAGTVEGLPVHAWLGPASPGPLRLVHALSPPKTPLPPDLRDTLALIK
jgi:hypothetical protein